MLDFNRSLTKQKCATEPINREIDRAIAERIAADERREYLGASALGSECLRKIQWDWTRRVAHEPRIQRIYDRGHWFETLAVKLLEAAGFKIVRAGPATEFEQLSGRFKGHADGIIIAGPDVEGVAYPCLWECKGLGAKGWTKLSNDGLAKAYPGYADQVALYQAYLNVTDNPCVFTASNMDTMELLHLLVPFDQDRAQVASDRAVAVISAEQAGETLPRVTSNPEDWRCRFCSHREACWA